MEGLWHWIWLPAVVLPAALIYYLIQSNRKRSEALQRFAALMGFQYSEKADLVAELQASGFRLFTHGRSKKSSRLLSGQTGAVSVRIFDYRYVSGAGKNSRTVAQTVILLNSDRLDLPRFALQPENIFHKIGQAFGMKDIDFDLYPEFSKRYLLRGDDEEAVRNLFKSYVLEFLTRQPGLHVEGAAQAMIIYRLGKRIPPLKLEAEYRAALEINELLKSRA